MPADKQPVSIDRRAQRRGIYLLPNLITTAALLAGFYSIVNAMRATPENGLFVVAAISIIVAGVLDGMDGRVARMTNTQSEFGVQFDSLSDMVSFGVAPAILSFSFALQYGGKVGWIAAFIFVACAALRLARFNVQTETADKRFFTGLASPAAAGTVAALTWTLGDMAVDGRDWLVLYLPLTAALGGLMVSNVNYRSFKELDPGSKVPFVALAAVVVVYAVISLDPPRVLLLIAMIYLFSGPAEWALGRLRPGKPSGN
ncbi:CDP-diacylglycerol--serine O-phosphatidyltransferase [Litorivicinus lipolyticus]|uniref:CDP-diacylglycerol--serine O-phosphatidyltransferase n=1 Tax=Litorivicinus lipolyticus TaxID=418701 RepID=A0A5Q2QIJ9_9GAMM|nr:CDP-diacylglycerol--serine O-phosphatidyltransferase [Litorivicinus lipolyticus]QGG80885.1 CDP-diacylglycerol--serine O-phosphatidyltransferase [Litorivicinus lipolyticus]